MSELFRFGLLVVCVAASSWILERWIGGATTRVDAALRASTIAAAVIVGSMLVPGAAGVLRFSSVFLIEAAIVAATLPLIARIARRRRVPFEALRVDDLPLAPTILVGTFVAFACAFAIRYAPFTLYDSLSYHLHFAARWVQDHAIEIVPTPFSDEAQAYAPGNGELVLAWMMLPFGSDAIARFGQLPFALVGATAVYAIARRLRRPPAFAVYPAAFFLLSRPIAEQMVGANVDVICSAFFLAALYFVVRAVDTDDRRDWLVAGIAAGLYAGTKYLALVYVPVLAGVAVARGLRRRALWAMPGLAAFGLPWYARNWMVAGSPIYPASLTLAGVTVARGAFTRAAMMNTVFHTTDVRLLPAIAAHAVGPALLVVWLPCAIAGLVLMARREWWPTVAIAVVPIAMVPLYWFGLPVNVDSRFLMPAIGPAMVPLAFLFTDDRRWQRAVHVGYAAALIWLIVGLRGSLPGDLPWFMGGWLRLDGLVPARFLLAFGACATALAMVWVATRRMPRMAPAALAAAIVCATATLAFGSPRWCGEDGCAYLETTSPFVRAGYRDAWRWIAGNVDGATIAYTGINLPYPLTGRRLANRVVYINIDGRARWRFHDYDRAYRAGRFVPDPPVLAESSGELLPVAHRPGPRDDAVRPRYERMHGNRDAWVFALESAHVRYLFVAMLSAYEIDYVWHNERGFPIEDDWALADPIRFHLVFANSQVHVYEVDDAARARG